MLGPDVEPVQEGIFVHFDRCGLKGPSGVMHFCAKKRAPFALAVQAIALGRPRLKRVGGRSDLLDGAILGRKRLLINAVMVVNRCPTIVDRNTTVSIGKVKESPGCPNGKAPRDIEAEKPDTGLALVSDVGPHVYFGKVAKIRDLREVPEGHSFHVEGNDCYIGFAVMNINLQLIRNAGSQVVNIDFPVEEQQVHPGLGEQPLLVWQCPGSMIDLREGWMVEG